MDLQVGKKRAPMKTNLTHPFLAKKATIAQIMKAKLKVKLSLGSRYLLTDIKNFIFTDSRDEYFLKSYQRDRKQSEKWENKHRPRFTAQKQHHRKK